MEKHIVKLKPFFEKIKNPIFYKNFQGIYEYCNKSFYNLLMLEEKDIIGKSAYDIFPENFARLYMNSDENLIKSDSVQSYETKVFRKDNTIHDIFVTKSLILDSLGKVSGILGIIIDITERIQKEKRMQKLLKIKDAILTVNDASTKVVKIEDFYNLILEEVLKLVPTSNAGSIMLLNEDNYLSIVSSKGFDKDLANTFKIHLEDSYYWKKTRAKSKKAKVFNDDVLENNELPLKINSIDSSIQSTISAPIYINNSIFGLLNIDSKDINVFNEDDLELIELMQKQIENAVEKYKLYEEVRFLSQYDPLTKIYNRSFFEKTLQSTFARAIRYKETFCLVMIDLNNLKRINDSLGHLAGDSFIKCFAQSMKMQIRESDIICRYGGDEFTIIFHNSTLDEIESKMKVLLEKEKKHHMFYKGHKIHYDFSYGVAQFPDDGKTFEPLLDTADKRMYKNKIKQKKNK